MLLKNMYQWKVELEERIQQLENRKKSYQEGSLWINKKGDKVEYYHYLPKPKQQSLYLSMKEAEQIRELAQKEYDEKLLLLLKKELKSLEQYLKRNKRDEIKELYANIHEKKKLWITPLYLNDVEYVKKWLSAPCESKSFADDYPEIYTEKGERVRSKSEKIIADKLNLLNIPYRYEAPVYLKGLGTVYPDFTVLNVSDRKTYYWEHLGMMDNSEYCEHALNKISFYEKNGILLGKDLIITRETSKKPLDMRIVEQYIESYLQK